MSKPAWDRLWTGANLATMTDASMGVVEDGALAAKDGRIAWVGRARDLPRDAKTRAGAVIDCDGAWMTPGLVDCHTHLVFGGDRTGDFRRRLGGESYEEIARAGGGIWSTVLATRRASARELAESASARVRDLTAWGVTTIEIKSGYGLDVETELKMLDVAAGLGRDLPVDVSPTLLAAHALPPEFAGRRAEYVEHVVKEMIPAAAEQGHATAVDVFCEGIAFSPAESKKVLEAGLAVGLQARVHADQLSDTGGGVLAASLGARSADHLEHLSPEGVAAMAEADVAAVLLPGAAYTLDADRKPPVAGLRKAGATLALATDANPGSSPITNVGMILNLACILFRTTPAEALTGFTRAAAKALGLDGDRGTLERGKRADLAIWNVRDPAFLCYWMGQSPLAGLVKDGEPISANRVSLPDAAPAPGTTGPASRP